MTARELKTGEKYRVVKPGASLQWWKPCGPNCQQGASLKLAIGDVITYDCSAYGGGSDDVYYNYFKKDGQLGQFWPNNWGTCDTSFLEPVATPVGVT
jgi:hypothetical protein